MALLEVKDLQVYYGVIQALKGISFEVNEGEIVTYLDALDNEQIQPILL